MAAAVSLTRYLRASAPSVASITIVTAIAPERPTKRPLQKPLHRERHKKKCRGGVDMNEVTPNGLLKGGAARHYL